jgi:predicted phage-related endonuclease
MTDQIAVEATLDEIIAKAKDTLITGKPKATADDRKAVEAADPITANELLAQRSNLDDQIKALTAQKKAIDDILKDAIGKDDVLLVNGAEVASISRWRETQLNSEFIKENFAVADYPDMFTRVSKSRLNIKK